MALQSLTMFKWRSLNFFQFVALAFLVQIFLGGIDVCAIDADTSGDTDSSGGTDESIDETGEVSSEGLSTNGGSSIDGSGSSTGGSEIASGDDTVSSDSTDGSDDGTGEEEGGLSTNGGSSFDGSGSVTGGSQTASRPDNAGDTDSSYSIVESDDEIGKSGEEAANGSIGDSISGGVSSTGGASTGVSGSSSGGSEVVSPTDNVGDTGSSGGSSTDNSGSSSGESADDSGNDEGSNKNSVDWNIETGDTSGIEAASSDDGSGWMNKIIESMIGIKIEQGSSGSSNGDNQNMNTMIGKILGSLGGQNGSDDSFGKTISGIWEMITGNSDGSTEGNSAFDLDSINNMRIQEIVSIIGRFIRNLPEETAADLTDEDIETIIRNVIGSLGGGTINISGGASGDTDDTSSVGVETVGDLLTVLQKSSSSTLLKAIAEYLSKWKITVDNTRYGILELVTMPQKQLYRIIQYVIANFQTIVDSLARSVVGENVLLDTILGFGNKTIGCVVSSAVDLPGVVGNELVECVTGRVNVFIQLVIDAVLEIRSSLLLLRHIVDSVTGCSGLFCLGAATATTMTNGISLVINVVSTVAHVAFFLSTLAVQLPGCFVGSVTLTPGEEVAKIIGRFGICMIP